MATLHFFKNSTHLVEKKLEIGAPYSAFTGPCNRCKIFARKGPGSLYCSVCEAILRIARSGPSFASKYVVVWAYVNQLPKKLTETRLASPDYLYIHDDNHFLQVLQRRKLKDWLQNLLLYNAADVRGLWQIFPTVGSRSPIQMGEAICWAAHCEAMLPMDQWYVRFFMGAQHIRRVRKLEREGLLTYHISEFLNLLEMAHVFRTLLRPYEQKQLYALLTYENIKEEQFFWGRFLGQIDQEVKDMLAEWKIRQWSKGQINILYELLKYVPFPASS